MPTCTSDCLTEIGILMLQHPSVSRKSRIQCLASHTFSGFRRWNVVISRARSCALPCTHTHTHLRGQPWEKKTTDCQWPVQRSLRIHFHMHTSLQRGERGFVRKCQLPQASAHLYFTAFRQSQFFHRMLKTIFPGYPPSPPPPNTHFSLFITAHNSSPANGPIFFFIFFSLSKIRTLLIYRGDEGRGARGINIRMKNAIKSESTVHVRPRSSCTCVGRILRRRARMHSVITANRRMCVCA